MSAKRGVPYDYVQALFAFGKFGYITHGESGHLKRVLRKLVRAAVLEVLPLAMHQVWRNREADRIAKALVP